MSRLISFLSLSKAFVFIQDNNQVYLNLTSGSGVYGL